MRHRYQSKTCVGHIQQVIDKSLINPANSSTNLYFLHVRVICFQYCTKRMSKSNQENFNFLIDSMDISRLTITEIDCKHI